MIAGVDLVGVLAGHVLTATDVLLHEATVGAMRALDHLTTAALRSQEAQACRARRRRSALSKPTPESATAPGSAAAPLAADLVRSNLRADAAKQQEGRRRASPTAVR